MAQQQTTPAQQAVEFPPIETWQNEYPQREFVIRINVPEFTSVCPRTGLPDYGEIQINYIPDKLVIELKAFKYYMLAYRNYGIFYENAINKILDDIVAAIDPRFMEIYAEFTPRGGISTGIHVIHRQDGYEAPAELMILD